MKPNTFNNNQTGTGSGFDLFRISHSKTIVDVSPNTLRSYHAHGLPFYRQGKAIFVSKSELESFIRSGNSIAQKGARL